MTKSIPTAEDTVILDASAYKNGVWFQNFDTTNGVYLRPCVTKEEEEPAEPESEFFLPPATSATSPSTLTIQNTGGDTTLVNRQWRAYQASGGSVDINCGKWQ